MPLMKFDLLEGRSEAQVKRLLDAAHEAMVQAFSVPATDRYQLVTQHRQGEIVVEDTGLGYARSRDVVVLTVVSRPRTASQKTELYRLLAEKLQEQVGLRPEDLIISLVENSDADWSFGMGRAQFLTKEL